MNSKYNLLLCELHHPNIHGKTDTSDSNIETHYLVYDRFQPWTGMSYYSLYDNSDNDDDDDDDDIFEDVNNPNHIDTLDVVMSFLRNHYSYLSNQSTVQLNHPCIRNYHNIIANPNYIKPEIGEYIILPIQEAVAILKTFWLRIVQRRWKNIYTERIRVKMERLQPASLHYRLAHGRWPPSCDYLPSLDGMLQDLS